MLSCLNTIPEIDFKMGSRDLDHAPFMANFCARLVLANVYQRAKLEACTLYHC